MKITYLGFIITITFFIFCRGYTKLDTTKRDPYLCSSLSPEEEEWYYWDSQIPDRYMGMVYEHVRTVFPPLPISRGYVTVEYFEYTNDTTYVSY
jgi:hypothetical protein